MDTERLFQRVDDAVAALEDLVISAGRISQALERLVEIADEDLALLRKED